MHIWGSVNWTIFILWTLYSGEYAGLSKSLKLNASVKVNDDDPYDT